MTASISQAATLASSSSMPRLLSDASASAALCAMRAVWNALGLLPRPQPACLAQPLQQRGHEPSLGHASPRPSGAGSPRIDLGAVTNRCLPASFATVEGALPSVRAISRHVLPLSSICSMVLRSCLVSLAYDLREGGLPPLFELPAIPFPPICNVPASPAPR